MKPLFLPEYLLSVCMCLIYGKGFVGVSNTFVIAFLSFLLVVTIYIVMRWAKVWQMPKHGRMFGSATCDYSAELRQKFGVICGFAFTARHWR